MSFFIKVKNYRVPSLAEMNRLALKYIFDKEHFTVIEGAWLDEGIKQWPRKINITPEEKEELRAILNALLGNEEGKYNLIKEGLKRHKLDYRKVYDAGI